MPFIKDLYRDEIRSGYLVTSDIKKVWNRQFEILQELDRICRKHAIPYWAAYGTLLGAARHRGFIPWDTDMDFCMMRPDYDRFTEIVADELRGGVFELKDTLLGLTKISHSRTTMIDNTYAQNKPQGLAIDIFALDIANDSTAESRLAYRALNELLMAAYGYSTLMRAVEEGRIQLLNEPAALKKIYDLPEENDKLKLLALYLNGLFNQSSAVAWIQDTENKINGTFQKSWFRETIYLPFETVKLPAPIDYDKVLTSYYGDWRTPFNDCAEKLGSIHTADIPWRDFLAQADFNLFFPNKK